MTALPPGYDHWRTTPPEDAHHRDLVWCTVETPLCIEAGDITIDAMGVYSAEDGALLSVTISGRPVSTSDVATALRLLCPGDAGPWDADLCAVKLAELNAEAAEDYDCGLADYRRDL